MSKLDDLKTKAADKLATVHADVSAYVTALEAKVSGNRYTIYAIAALGIIVAVSVWHCTHK